MGDRKCSMPFPTSSCILGFAFQYRSLCWSLLLAEAQVILAAGVTLIAVVVIAIMIDKNEKQ